VTKINVGCEIEYAVESPTSFLFQINAAQMGRQTIASENLSSSPGIVLERLLVGMQANISQRCLVQPGNFHLRYEATVELLPEVEFANELVELPFNELPFEVLPYLNPSRYCESDLLGNFAIMEFGNLPSGLRRVRAVCEWVFNNLRYVSGSTDSQTTAQDVFVQRQGVCRDYAHLSIAFCRAIGIPARYVCGYAINLQPPDFHGFFEVYLGNNWYLFDATRMALTNGLIRIATGHDAADVPFATLIGAANLMTKKVWAELPTGAAISTLNDDQGAISTA
jgi:transglutaminase-like putative cysteine protease